MEYTCSKLFVFQTLPFLEYTFPLIFSLSNIVKVIGNMVFYYFLHNHKQQGSHLFVV